MRPVWSPLIAALVSCTATTPHVVTLEQSNTAAHPVESRSITTFGLGDELGTFEQRRMGYSKDDAWLGYEISTCDPCPSEFHFEAKGQKAIDLAYYYEPGDDDAAAGAKHDATVDAKLKELGVEKAIDGRKLRGPFPYPDLHFETKVESDIETGEATLRFGANGVFPMHVTVGPFPTFSKLPKEEREQYMLEPIVAYANVTHDGSEIGIVVVTAGPMWVEMAGVARMRTTDFVAAVRRR